MSEGTTPIDNGARERLLLALVEHLKSPLLNIARGAELSRQVQGTRHLTDILKHIELTAETTLQLLDNYLLSDKWENSQLTFALEPLAIPSVLYDSAQDLQHVAQQYDCEVRVDFKQASAPVMAHSKGLRAALVTLGQAFIDAQQACEMPEQRVITLGAHRSRDGGIVTGIFADVEGLNKAMFKRARTQYGHTKTPLREVNVSSGAAIFIADSLMGAMAAPLKVAQHRRQGGLATTLLPSQQLTIV
jgi:hypothetical protein